jgi:Domain of unknown function (DUF6265)
MTYRSLGTKMLLAVALQCTLLLSTLKSASAQGSVASLSFLAGRWTASGPDGLQEENWSPPLGGNVMGSFRILKSGHAVFFEFWSIEEQNGKIVMLVKHYDAGLKGWEEKDKATELQLTKTGPHTAELSGSNVTLNYERTGEYLAATVTHMRAGKPETESFRLKRAVTPAK